MQHAGALGSRSDASAYPSPARGGGPGRTSPYPSRAPHTGIGGWAACLDPARDYRFSWCRFSSSSPSMSFACCSFGSSENRVSPLMLPFPLPCQRSSEVGDSLVFGLWWCRRCRHGASPLFRNRSVAGGMGEGVRSHSGTAAPRGCPVSVRRSSGPAGVGLARGTRPSPLIRGLDEVVTLLDLSGVEGIQSGRRGRCVRAAACARFHRLPGAVLREARAAGAEQVALYVMDIDGSRLIRLGGDDSSPIASRLHWAWAPNFLRRRLPRSRTSCPPRCLGQA